MTSSKLLPDEQCRSNCSNISSSPPTLDQRQSKWFVISGPPHSGKTTVINLLASIGYETVPEAARRVIERGVKGGSDKLAIRSNPVEFQRDVLKECIAMEGAVARDRITFFDRAIPDNVAYMMAYRADLNDPCLVGALRSCRFAGVFLFDPIPFDHNQDAARTETKAEVATIQGLLSRAYEGLSIPIVRVSAQLEPIDRMRVVLGNIGSSPATNDH
jgi:predicted ATPase